MFGTIFFWYEFKKIYKKFGIKFFFGMNFFLWFFSYWMVKFSKIMVHFVKKNTIFFIIFGIAVNYHVNDNKAGVPNGIGRREGFGVMKDMGN